MGRFLGFVGRFLGIVSGKELVGRFSDRELLGNDGLSFLLGKLF